MRVRSLCLVFMAAMACGDDTVTTANEPPTARIMGPTEVGLNQLVTLTASGRDADFDPLTFAWSLVTQPAGAQLVLTSVTTNRLDVEIEVPGEYVFQVRVHDGTTHVDVTHSIRASNSAPVANAGLDVGVRTGDMAALDGIMSVDPDGQMLAFRWRIASKPSGSAAAIAHPTYPSTSFVADLDGQYLIELVVNDGFLDSVPDTVTIFAANNVNQRPVARAGADLSGAVGVAVPLDGSGSTDPEGANLSYEWTLSARPAGSAATLSDATTARARFVPDIEGAYTASLVVRDGQLASAPDDVIVQVMRVVSPGGFDNLRYRVIDAEYSRALDRLVMVSESPHQLHLYDPQTRSDASIALPALPTSVSVGPNGRLAAVGHDGFVTIVNLESRTATTTLPIACAVLDVILAGNGHVYALPVRDQWEHVYYVHIASGLGGQSSGRSIYAGTLGRLHPSGSYIYGADNGLSPSDIEKYDVRRGAVEYLYDSPYHGDYAMCGNLWFTEDGDRIITRCGNVFRSSELRDSDMMYAGSLSMTAMQWVSHSRAAGKIVGIPLANRFGSMNADTRVMVFEDQFLGSVSSADLPEWAGPNSGMVRPRAHGRWVFHRSTGDEVYVVIQADPSTGVANDFGVLSMR